VLIQALDDDIPQIQLDAIRKITKLGNNAEAAGEALRKLRTRSDDEQLREEANKALKALREPPPKPKKADIDEIDRAFDDALEEI
jgi:Sec-independent protein translocase protein TatA